MSEEFWKGYQEEFDPHKMIDEIVSRMRDEHLGYSLASDEMSEAGIEMAWSNIRAYLSMAHLQRKRMDADVQQIRDIAPDVIPPPLPENYTDADRDAQLNDYRNRELANVVAHHQLLIDAHFYLSCWRIIALNCYQVMKIIQHPWLDAFCRRQECSSDRFRRAKGPNTLGWYAHGRDHFEHINERIAGGEEFERMKINRPLEQVWNTGVIFFRGDEGDYATPSVTDDRLWIGSESWDLGPDSQTRLANIVHDYVNVLRKIIKEDLLPRSYKQLPSSDIH